MMRISRVGKKRGEDGNCFVVDNLPLEDNVEGLASRHRITEYTSASEK